MSARVGLRFLHNSSRPTFALRAAPRRPIGRRYQTTGAGTTAGEPQSFFQKLWTSPVGLKTVHFWAPVMKWALVIAGISDFGRPAEKLSVTQNLALTCTGAIWTRWCFIIKPRNIFLATVNFFLGCVGIVQVSRIFMYRRSLKGESTTEAAKDLGEDVKGTAEEVAGNAEAKAKQVAS